ncbi:MAG: lipocalin family protein [Deltaproteobacteria bacterium]|nr:lipocalin family protein [Deltaproteobacteria bacterium]
MADGSNRRHHGGTTLARLETIPPAALECSLARGDDLLNSDRLCVGGHLPGTTAAYTLRADGDIDIVNRCRKNSLTGNEDTVKGLARVVDTVTHAKLEVSFFRPFWGDYWIIDLADDYSFAVVGHPSRDYLWILSRTPVLDSKEYNQILVRLRAQGYEVERLRKTPHASPPAQIASTAR